MNGHCLLVFGGAGQARLLNDLWVFDTTTCAWTFPTFAGQCPAAREMHTATMVTPTDMLVFAGRNSLGTAARSGSMPSLAAGPPSPTDVPIPLVGDFQNATRIQRWFDLKNKAQSLTESTQSTEKAERMAHKGPWLVVFLSPTVQGR